MFYILKWNTLLSTNKNDFDHWLFGFVDGVEYDDGFRNACAVFMMLRSIDQRILKVLRNRKFRYQIKKERNEEEKRAIIFWGYEVQKIRKTQ